MSIERIRNKLPSLAKDLAVFAGILAFCAYSMHMLSKNPGNTQSEIVPAGLEADRQPSSSTSPSKEAEEKGTATLHLPCLRGTKGGQSSPARLVQLRAGPCLEFRTPHQSWTARNERTGEELQVFVNEAEGTLSTNYFLLKQGRNHLTFAKQGSSGATRTEALEINRTTADED
jgi:hypothetical protein